MKFLLKTFKKDNYIPFFWNSVYYNPYDCGVFKHTPQHQYLNAKKPKKGLVLSLNMTRSLSMLDRLINLCIRNGNRLKAALLVNSVVDQIFFTALYEGSESVLESTILNYPNFALFVEKADTTQVDINNTMTQTIGELSPVFNIIMRRKPKGMKKKSKEKHKGDVVYVPPKKRRAVALRWVATSMDLFDGDSAQDRLYSALMDALFMEDASHIVKKKYATYKRAVKAHKEATS